MIVTSSLEAYDSGFKSQEWLPEYVVFLFCAEHELNHARNKNDKPAKIRWAGIAFATELDLGCQLLVSWVCCCASEKKTTGIYE